MWTGEVNLVDACTISAMGLSTVFLTLISLAIAVVIVSKVLLSLGIGKKEQPKVTAIPDTTATTVATGENNETYAAIVAAVSEEMKLPVDKFRIVSITEIA